MNNEFEEYKPLTEADAPYQKLAPKEVADAIDKALGLKTLTDEEIEEIIDNVIDAMGISYASCCVRKDGWKRGVKKFKDLLKYVNKYTD